MTDERREMLWAYVLGTLDPGDRARIERQLDRDPELRAALEQEERALRALDQLDDLSPPDGLAETTAREVLLARPAAAPPEVARSRYYRVAAVAAVALVGLFLWGQVGRMRESAQRASSAGNLKQMALIYKMYAGENRGVYPPVAPWEGVWAPDLRVLFPHFMYDPTPLVNPRLPGWKKTLAHLRDALEADPPRWEEACRIAARNYTYSGWCITAEDQLPEVLDRYRLLARAGTLDQDLTARGRPVPRLREGVERFFITDINNPAAGTAPQSTIPVMFEIAQNPDGGEPAGCNVLYMDGHVGYLDFGEAFPALPAVGESFPPPEAP